MCKQKFLDIDSQIQLLKNRGLNFKDEEKAKYLIQYNGYYNIINGYKESFIDKNNDEDQYKPNVYFEDIYRLFEIDNSIKNEIAKSISSIEIHLKSNLSYVVSKYYSENFVKYSDINNYFSPSNKRTSFFKLDKVISDLNTVYNSTNDTLIKYHKDKYSNVPPWVLLKSTYISTTISWCHYLFPKQKEELICLFYNLDFDKFNSLNLKEKELIKELFSESLSIIWSYRNLCSHCGRIYDFKTPNTINHKAFNFFSTFLGLKIDKFKHSKSGLDNLLMSTLLIPDADKNYISLFTPVQNRINDLEIYFNNRSIEHYKILSNIIQKY